jgi:nucleoside-diphosphate-sugar epimerase
VSDALIVTGAGGFVGRALVPVLEREGLAVRSHTRRDGDLASGLAAEPASCVVHLAGRTFVPESWENPLAFYRDNTLATGGVLEYCRRTGARLVHLSSYVYGTPDSLPISESHPRRPFNPYALSKILAEDLIAFHEARFGLRATVIRPFNLYGPGQDDRFLIPSIARQMADPACARIAVQDLRPKRDYLHVDDLVRLIVLAVRADRPGIYNAGTGASVSVGDVITEMAAAAGMQKPVDVTGESRPGEVLDVVADSTRAKDAFGWQPIVSLRQGLAGMLTWSREHRA